ncbi:MAG: hypothetical protein D6718_03655 [Acidobacteria bacterium]|nr:MAG: hypothetical protein D6718_03655 [Acidobacteriota bacterium]
MTGALPALRVGGLYRARALRLLPDGRVRLQLGGGTVTARALRPVRAGQALVVEVVRLCPEVVLRVRAAGKDLPGG